MSRRSWRERSCVYVVTVNGFPPTSPWAWPDQFDGGRIHVKNITLTEAKAVAGAFNKRAMQQREAIPAKWDRQWAIAGCCLRNKGRDLNEDVPERPQRPEPEHGGTYTSEEVERLLAVCNEALLPEIPGVSPDAWWRGFITISLTTGLRPSELLEMRCKGGGWLFPWPHSKESLYATFGFLVSAAGMDPDSRHGLHSLRLTWRERQLRKGGDRNRRAMLNKKIMESELDKAEVYSELAHLDEQKRRLVAKLAKITLAVEEAARDAVNYRGEPEPKGGVA